MRALTPLLAVALAFSPIAAANAAAGNGPNHGHGNSGNGNGHGHGGGGGGGGGGGPEAMIEGAGQRLHFSFGGRIRLRGDKATGNFGVVVHPLSPQGVTVVVACKYTQFSNVTISATSATFRGEGRCERLLSNGTFESLPAVNDFQIVNGDPNDSIDVNFVGETGIAVPGGALDYGNFTLRPA